MKIDPKTIDDFPICSDILEEHGFGKVANLLREIHELASIKKGDVVYGDGNGNFKSILNDNFSLAGVASENSISVEQNIAISTKVYSQGNGDITFEDNGFPVGNIIDGSRIQLDIPSQFTIGELYNLGPTTPDADPTDDDDRPVSD